MLSVPVGERAGTLEDENYLLETEDAGYQVTFARLAIVGRKAKDYAGHAGDVKQFAFESISKLRQSPQGQQLPQEIFNPLIAFFNQPK
jgi:hypothetical protein